MSVFDKLFENISWLRIFLSPFLAGLIIGIILWFYNDSIYLKILSLAIILIGFVFGIYFAERIRKKVGTQEFISQLSATPDLDSNEDTNE